MNKIFTGVLFSLISLVSLGYFIYSNIYAGYEWDNTVLSNWTLSDKSSTLQAKADYMDKFVLALQSNNLADNDALIYKTADNNCQNNIQAVSTLKDRLTQIKGMDESSFQYQQAISQITQQEQGEANTLLSTLNGCWLKTHHYNLWNIWIIIFIIIEIVFTGVMGIVILFSDDYCYFS